MNGIRISERVAAPRSTELILATDGSFAKNAHSSAFMTTDGQLGIHAENYGRNTEPCGGACSHASEMRAIALGIQAIPLGTNVTILSDSLGSLDTIDRWQNGSTEMPKWYSPAQDPKLQLPSLVTLRDRVASDATHIRTRHVSGHSGDLLNEAADALANIGRSVCRMVYTQDQARSRAMGLVASFLISFAQK